MSLLSFLILHLLLASINSTTQAMQVCAKGNPICIPENYSRFDIPNETNTVVNVGIDIKDIPKIDDNDFSVTLNALFVVRWKDERPFCLVKRTVVKNENEINPYKEYKNTESV